MKTCKSLLVKFLTVLCALCLSLSVAFGLVACGEETVSVVGAEINSENKLVLTYSDGTTKTLDIVGKDGVDGEDGEDGKDLTACDHKNSVINEYKMSIKDIDPEAKFADVCTIQQAVCLDCDYLYVVAHGHDFKDVDAVAATCYAEGHEAGKECKDCGYFTGGAITEKVEHTPTTYFVAYNNPALTTCVDGGFTVTICEACKEGGAYEDAIEGNELAITYVQTSGLGHSSTAWKKHDNDPTLASAGTLIADVCDECGTANVTMDLPKLDEVNYVKTTKVAKVQCTDTETYNYQIKVGEQTFDFEVVSAPGNHKISDAIVFEDGKVYNYDEALFKTFANAEKTCSSLGFDVYFECKECGESIQTKAKVAHETVFENADDPATEAVETPDVATPATCEGKGYYKAYDCSVCGTHIDAPEALEFAALGHEYKAYAIVAENADGTVDLASKCTRWDVCGKVDTIAKAAATYVKEDATCKAAGKETWTVTAINGVELEEALVAEKEIPVLAHKLGEEEMDLTKVYDWTVYEAKGLKTFANVEKTCEAGGFDARFTCSVCGDDLQVKAEVPHKIPVDQDGEQIITVIESTCGVKGSETYTCAVCNKPQTKELDALVHEYKYTMVTSDTDSDGIDDWAVITGTCVHGDKHLVATPEVEPYKTITAYDGALSALTSTDKVVATCKVDGIKVYSWTPTGSTTPVTAEVNVGKTLHKLGDKEIDTAITHDVGNGIKEFGNSAPACDSATPGSGHFECSVCREDILVSVKKPHTKPAATEVTIVEATCSNIGTVDYTCTVCNEAVHEVYPALQHVVNYKLNTLVKPTATTAGEIYVGCATCTAKDAKVVIPALNTAVKAADATAADNFTYVVVTEATCAVEGVKTYTYVDATYGAITFNVVESKTGHGFVQPPFSWTYNGYIYTGRICADCGKLIVESKVAAPQA